MKSYVILYMILFFMSSCTINNEYFKNIVTEQSSSDEQTVKEDVVTKQLEKEVTVIEEPILDEPVTEFIVVEEPLQEEFSDIFIIKNDVNFYSQFPLTGTGKYDEPYQNFCEESSLLNAYYFFKGTTPLKYEYVNDLNKLKEIEDRLFGKYGYKDTSIGQSLLAFLFFQNDNYIGDFLKNSNYDDRQNVLEKLVAENRKQGGVIGKIEYFPSYSGDKEEVKKEIYFEILKALREGDLVIIPAYGKGLKNPYFTDGGPNYHNFLITGMRGKGMDEGVFITQEVGISRGADFEYDKNIVLENIYDYDKSLYPEHFTDGKQKILILSKNNNFNITLKDLYY